MVSWSQEAACWTFLCQWGCSAYFDTEAEALDAFLNHECF